MLVSGVEASLAPKLKCDRIDPQQCYAAHFESFDTMPMQGATGLILLVLRTATLIGRAVQTPAPRTIFLLVYDAYRATEPRFMRRKRDLIAVHHVLMSLNQLETGSWLS